MFRALLPQVNGAPLDPCNIVRLPPGSGAQYEFGPRPDITGREIIHPRLIPGEKTLILIAAGQSNIANSETGTTGEDSSVGGYNQYQSIHGTKVQNLNIFDGGVYKAVTPLLGCSTGIAAITWTADAGNWLIRLADKFITAGVADRVILVPCAMGGSSTGQWLDIRANRDRIRAVAKRLSALGYTPSAVLWQQGETDAFFEFKGTQSAATYETNMDAIIQEFRDQGITCPFFIAKSTFMGRYETLSGLTIASPCVLTWPETHNFVGDEEIVFTSTTGALPTGLALNTQYYVRATNLTATTFEISTTKGGAAINTSGTQSGSHTVLMGRLNADIRAKVDALIDNPNGIYAGPDTDTLTRVTSQRQSLDNTHFNSAGADEAANRWKTSLAAYGTPFV